MAVIHARSDVARRSTLRKSLSAPKRGVRATVAKEVEEWVAQKGFGAEFREALRLMKSYFANAKAISARLFDTLTEEGEEPRVIFEVLTNVQRPEFRDAEDAFHKQSWASCPNSYP